ncbi:MAG: SiaB family protein kinase [Bacteroidia bacterium]|nr:SiaB family protein kinase [Bacteroidia bacterium]
MNDTPAVPHTSDERQLSFTYPTFKDMQDNNVIFVYKGIVNSDLVTHVLEMMSEKMEEDKQDRRLSKKVFNVMVECLTGAYTDEALEGKEGYDPTTVLLVKRDDTAYVVATGYYIHNPKVQTIKHMLDRINGMSIEEMKEFYQEVISREDPGATGFTDLAIIDLARKSKHKLQYQFKYISPEFTFFSLESRISQQSL